MNGTEHEELVERALDAIVRRQESRCRCNACVMAYAERAPILDRKLLEKMPDSQLEFIIYGL